MATTTNLEYQLRILENRLCVTPEKIGVKYNPGYFALRGKIKKIKEALAVRKQFEFLAQ